MTTLLSSFALVLAGLAHAESEPLRPHVNFSRRGLSELKAFQKAAESGRADTVALGSPYEFARVIRMQARTYVQQIQGDTETGRVLLWGYVLPQLEGSIARVWHDDSAGRLRVERNIGSGISAHDVYSIREIQGLYFVRTESTGARGLYESGLAYHQAQLSPDGREVSLMSAFWREPLRLVWVKSSEIVRFNAVTAKTGEPVRLWIETSDFQHHEFNITREHDGRPVFHMVSSRSRVLDRSDLLARTQIAESDDCLTPLKR